MTFLPFECCYFLSFCCVVAVDVKPRRFVVFVLLYAYRIRQIVGVVFDDVAHLLGFHLRACQINGKTLNVSRQVRPIDVGVFLYFFTEVATQPTLAQLTSYLIPVIAIQRHVKNLCAQHQQRVQ